MNSYISIHTLNKIDFVINNYKKKILKDFYDNFIENKEDLDYQNFENSFLEKRREFILSKYKNISEENCHAYTWKKTYGLVQCCNKKKYKNYCGVHKDSQNYGSVNFNQ